MRFTSDDRPIQDRYDAIVVGAGSGGLTAAVGLSTLGRSVALVEAGHIGGDCTNVGCIPSKSLLHAAHSSPKTATDDSANDALDLVRSKRNRLRDKETHEFGEIDGIDLIFARAELLSPTSVVLKDEGDGALDQVIRAKEIVIATGSKPRRISIEGLPEQRYLNNENFFEQPELPKHLVILGGGPIGLEMAVAANDLGTKVTLLEAAPRLLPLLPELAGDKIAEALTKLGITILPGVTAKRYDEATRRLEIGPLEGEANDSINDVDAMLVAVGRVPNSSALGLEALGVEVEKGFIVTDRKGRTNVKTVWAIGDVTRRSQTTHGANAWGRRVVKAIAFPFMPAGSDPIVPAAIYSRPEVASIGEHLGEFGDDVNRLVYDISKIDRAYTDDVEDGVIIVDVRRLTGKVLAATIVGPRAAELIGVFSMAMTNDIPLHKWYSVVWPYPAYTDAISKIVDMHMSETLTNVKRESRRWLGGAISRRRP